jgi:hypothetical protein
MGLAGSPRLWVDIGRGFSSGSLPPGIRSRRAFPRRRINELDCFGESSSSQLLEHSDDRIRRRAREVYVALRLA